MAIVSSLMSVAPLLGAMKHSGERRTGKMESKAVLRTLILLALIGASGMTIVAAPASAIRPGMIRLGVWLPRYPGDLPPYGDLQASDIQAIDVTVLDETTLQNFDVIYIGRGGFYVHTGEGVLDPQAIKTWVRNGGGILGESEAVIYDSVVTLGNDWSPQLSEIFGVWSTEADGLDCDVSYNDTTITVTDPSHPITAGLPDDFSTTVYSAELYAYVDKGRNPTAKEIFTVTSYCCGEPYNMPIITADYGKGKSVHFPYCPDGYTDWASPGGLNLEKLFINAVKWAASYPTVMVYTDKYSYSVGDVMHLAVSLRNPGGPMTVCVAIWIELPGGETRVVLHRHSVTLPAGFKYDNPSFMTFTLPSLQSGIYTWHAGILDSPTHKIVFEDTTQWEFV